MIRVILPAGSMRMKALGAKPDPPGAAALAGARKPTSKPPPTAAPTCSSARRDGRRVGAIGSVMVAMADLWKSGGGDAGSGGLGGPFDSFPDARIGAAT